MVMVRLFIFTFVVLRAAVRQTSGSDFWQLALSWKHHRLWFWGQFCLILLHLQRSQHSSHLQEWKQAGSISADDKGDVYSRLLWRDIKQIYKWDCLCIAAAGDFSVFTVLCSLWEMRRWCRGQGCPQLNVKGRKLGQCASWGGYFWPPARLLKHLRAPERERDTHP